MGEMGGLLAVGCVLLVAFGSLGAWVAAQKRRSPGEGAILGACFGPIGVLVEALLPTGDVRPGAKPRASRPVAWDDPLGMRAREPAAEVPPASELPFLRQLEGDAGRRPRKPPEGGDDPLKVRTG